eukprot:Skav218039  [mRNA]  locus=scaffold214:603404:603835:- [translate_table: standard]
MPPKRSSKETKKIVLKSSTKKEHDFSVNEAMTLSKSAVETLVIKKLDIDKLVQSCNVETLSKIDHYLRHDKSNTALKIEKVAHFTEDVEKFILFRQFIDKVIVKSEELVHDAIVSKFTSSDENFDFEGFKAFISEMKGKKSRT